MRGQLLRLDLQLLRPVGDDIQRHGHSRAGVQIDLSVKAAGEQRRVDQSLIRRGFKEGGRPVRCTALQGCTQLPTIGQGNAGADGDAAGEITGWIKGHRPPLQIEHFRRHDDLPRVALHGREELEVQLEALGCDRRGHIEGEYLNGIAHPLDALTGSIDHQPASCPRGPLGE